jgi:hypothetical protein
MNSPQKLSVAGLHVSQALFSNILLSCKGAANASILIEMKATESYM